MGILHCPEVLSSLGLLVVHGRPATRVGKHRLFVLLARAWASAGIPVMRFDYRGTGDCAGRLMSFEETADDIRSAVDAFLSNLPGLERVVLWGLCGGAADALNYAPTDARVVGAVLVNPWTYDARVRAMVRVRAKFSSFFVRTRRFILRNGGDTPRLKQDLSGPPAPSAAAQLIDGSQEPDRDLGTAEQPTALGNEDAVLAYRSYRSPDLSKRLARSLEKFEGKVLIILGGGDVGAQTFKYTASLSFQWRRLLSEKRVTVLELPGANHSLRRREWREQAASWTLDWLHRLG
jgi:alpha-beta hydrolase superfamily lysophospholipase